MIIRKNNGAIGIDIALAIVIITFCVSIISSMLYNYSFTIKEIERKVKASYIAVQVIEAIKETEYGKVHDKMSLQEIEDASNRKIDLERGYEIDVQCQNYRDIKKDESLKDVLKYVTVNVHYSIGRVNRNLKLSTAITSI